MYVIINILLFLINLIFLFLLKKKFKVIKLEREKEIRKDALKRSESVNIGKSIEKFVPFISHTQYDPRDFRFIGDPIDYIIFDGLHKGIINSIIILEIKYGNSNLNKNQRMIRDYLKSNNVVWQELNIERVEK